MNPPRKYIGQPPRDITDLITSCETKYSVRLVWRDTTAHAFTFTNEIDAYLKLYEGLESEHATRIVLARHTQAGPGSPWYQIETLKDFWRSGAGQLNDL